MVEEDDNRGGTDDHDLVAAVSTPRHIKKRAFRNKALSIPFSDKDLKDYISGFHKRKKKRRKEAQKNLQEKERLKRIEERKKRKLEQVVLNDGYLPEESGEQTPVDLDDDLVDGCIEQEVVLNDGFLPEESGEPTPVDLDDDLVDGCKRSALVPGTKVYDMGETTITVTTSEIFPEEDKNDVEFHQFVRCSGTQTEHRKCIPLKKKPLKEVPGQKFQVMTKKSASQRKGKKLRNKG